MNLRRIVSIGAFAIVFSGGLAAAPVNVNTADSQRIAESLKGIGMVKAQRISDYCQEHKCTKAEDLLMIKGIGPKTLQIISDDLRFKD
ncbi:helix-hairpin-helix domain-containing protein [Thiomicrorhabdus sp. 6S2-11]|uniref:Helix-hairpin-helix domain-containing protein n=1 Tax=Thiomicrorhabdus marina TaxID=2818442 RepID=A0ABS3Q3I7_9GAMM|nr:helix-hairpin-helix domain-containing protein [Thiomicrorhabdus marina]MBO1926395.1 helix-hairpin-helix domain-containing protein [Thiomicrorhabdus marina]